MLDEVAKMRPFEIPLNCCQQEGPRVFRAQLTIVQALPGCLLHYSGGPGGNVRDKTPLAKQVRMWMHVLPWQLRPGSSAEAMPSIWLLTNRHPTSRLAYGGPACVPYAFPSLGPPALPGSPWGTVPVQWGCKSTCRKDRGHRVSLFSTMSLLSHCC